MEVAMSRDSIEQGVASQTVGHETSDIKAAGIFWFVVVFVVTGLALLFMVWWVFAGFTRHNARADAPTSPPLDERLHPPEPRLQPSAEHPTLPREDLAAMRGREDAEFARRGFRRGAEDEWIIPEQYVAQVRAMSSGGNTTQPSSSRELRSERSAP
jgi:hypothetical protein